MTRAEKAWEKACKEDLNDYIGGDLGGARTAMWHTQAARARDLILELYDRLGEAEMTISEALTREEAGVPLEGRVANLEGYLHRKERQWPGS